MQSEGCFRDENSDALHFKAPDCGVGEEAMSVEVSTNTLLAPPLLSTCRHFLVVVSRGLSASCISRLMRLVLPSLSCVLCSLSSCPLSCLSVSCASSLLYLSYVCSLVLAFDFALMSGECACGAVGAGADAGRTLHFRLQAGRWCSSIAISTLSPPRRSDRLFLAYTCQKF